jgi:hypothetical protein
MVSEIIVSRLTAGQSKTRSGDRTPARRRRHIAIQAHLKAEQREADPGKCKY